MGRVEAILAAALALSIAGCVNNSNKKSTAILQPPAPPTSPANLKPAKEPLSIPQTQVQLPPPQPWNPEALAVPAPPAAAAPSPASRPARRTPTAAPPPRVEAVAPAAPPAEPERAPIQEIVPADERRHFQESADARKRETGRLLQQAKARRLTADQRKVVTRIQSFMAQSDDAEKRGDMRQADALAERGLVLAKELAGGQ